MIACYYNDLHLLFCFVSFLWAYISCCQIALCLSIITFCSVVVIVLSRWTTLYGVLVVVVVIIKMSCLLFNVHCVQGCRQKFVLGVKFTLPDFGVYKFSNYCDVLTSLLGLTLGLHVPIYLHCYIPDCLISYTSCQRYRGLKSRSGRK